MPPPFYCHKVPWRFPNLHTLMPFFLDLVEAVVSAHSDTYTLMAITRTSFTSRVSIMVHDFIAPGFHGCGFLDGRRILAA